MATAALAGSRQIALGRALQQSCPVGSEVQGMSFKSSVTGAQTMARPDKQQQIPLVKCLQGQKRSGFGRSSSQEKVT